MSEPSNGTWPEAWTLMPQLMQEQALLTRYLREPSP